MKTLGVLYSWTFYKHLWYGFCTLFCGHSVVILYFCFFILVCFSCSFTEEISTFCSDFVWYSLYIWWTLHALLINIMCTLFIYISLTFYAVIFGLLLQRFYRHFMFSVTANYVVFIELLQRIFWDFTRIFKYIMKSL